MSRETQFRKQLDDLFHRRTEWLRRSVFGASPGKPPEFSKKRLDNAIERLLDIADDALTNKLARREFSRGVDHRRSWHCKRGKGHGIDRKRDHFSQWYDASFGTRACIYVFWARKRCVYVGKTKKGGSRPASHFEKYWFQPVTRVDIYGARGHRPLPALECLAVHRFGPSQNKNMPAQTKWHRRCPLCEVERHIATELRTIFRLR